MSRPVDPGGHRLHRAIRRELGIFVVSGLLVLAAVGWATVVLGGRVAEEDALGDAEHATRRLAQLVIAPLLVDSLTGRPGAEEDLRRVVANRMADGALHELVVWTADGVVLWSSDATITGSRHALTPEVRAALTGTTSASLAYERELGALTTASSSPELEVYVPAAGPDGTALVFEAYYDSEGLDRAADELRAQIVPVAVGALVLLQLVQVPIALRMGRRVGRQADERARLVARTLSASEQERSELAGQLHDGPVQDLAGLGYGLGALELQVDPAHRPAVHRLTGVLDAAVAGLRRLMVEVYPPDLAGEGLRWAVREQTLPLRAAGMAVAVDLGDPGQLAPEVAASVYRTAREALANCLRHSGAGTVSVALRPDTEDGVPGVRLTVSDDGIGLPPTGIDKRAEGHLGLRLLVDRATELGGHLAVGTGPSGGTALDLWLPGHPD